MGSAEYRQTARELITQAEEFGCTPQRMLWYFLAKAAIYALLAIAMEIHERS